MNIIFIVSPQKRGSVEKSNDLEEMWKSEKKESEIKENYLKTKISIKFSTTQGNTPFHIDFD